MEYDGDVAHAGTCSGPISLLHVMLYSCYCKPAFTCSSLLSLRHSDSSICQVTGQVTDT